MADYQLDDELAVNEWHPAICHRTAGEPVIYIYELFNFKELVWNAQKFLLLENLA